MKIKFIVQKQGVSYKNEYDTTKLATVFINFIFFVEFAEYLTSLYSYCNVLKIRLMSVLMSIPKSKQLPELPSKTSDL